MGHLGPARAIVVDVILLWLLWAAVLNGRSKLMWRLERRGKGWPGVLALTGRYIVGLAACLIPIGIAFTAATFPGEGLDEWSGKRRWIPPYPSAEWSDQEEWMSFLTTWYGQEGWTSFHDLLFNGKVDNVTRRRKSLFSNTLVLPVFDGLEAAKVDAKNLDNGSVKCAKPQDSCVESRSRFRRARVEAQQPGDTHEDIRCRRYRRGQCALKGACLRFVLPDQCGRRGALRRNTTPRS